MKNTNEYAASIIAHYNVIFNVGQEEKFLSAISGNHNNASNSLTLACDICANLDKLGKTAVAKDLEKEAAEFKKLLSDKLLELQADLSQKLAGTTIPCGMQSIISAQTPQEIIEALDEARRRCILEPLFEIAEIYKRSGFQNRLP